MTRRVPVPSRSRSETGSATMLALTFLVVLATVAAGVAVLGGLLVGQRRVESAADLAALAGARALQRGQDGCAAAARTARANGARQLHCTVSGPVLTVDVGDDLTGLVGRTVSVRARARAGPAG
ncbi:MAG TPA: Rv3654c family TadE-like protein [Nocardioidaceae bacterium]|nr:Rv3654c family TadE-like protein [Nocardioidaceae bacterium]